MKDSKFIVKSHLYGKNPGDIITVMFNLGDSQVTIRNASLSELDSALGESFIPQSEIKPMIEDLEEITDVYFKPEDILSFAKKQVFKAIAAYDTSDEVNRFTYSGLPLWLNQATRVGLMGRLNAEAKQGITDTTLWVNDMSLMVNVAQGIELVSAIEVYASKCYDVTASHKAEVKNLQTLEEVLSYDITKGYPEQLKF